QAEDGIRYFHVTGVQTCALPISGKSMHRPLQCAESRQRGDNDTAMLNSSPDQWRRRLLILRGMLILVLALVALTTSLQNLDLLTPQQAAIWLTLLWLPSVWYWPTRKLSLAMQSAWLTADLLCDSL